MEIKQNYPRNLVERAIITQDTQKAITEYHQLKSQEQQIKKYPNWDVAQSGQGIKLLKAYRELAQAENNLETKRKEQVEKHQHMQQQWAEMRRKETLFRELFIKFNQFIIENGQKRERAMRKITEEKECSERYHQEIEELNKKLQHLTSVCDKMQESIEYFKRGKNYLERVVNETGEFSSINDIFNRYESLMEARQTHVDSQDKNFEQIEGIGNQMQHMTQEKEQKLMNLNNQLADLQIQYDKAKAETMKWEKIVSQIKAVVSVKILELIRIQSACWNLYTQIRKRKGLRVEIAKDEIETQLIEIKQTILVLKNIVKAAEKQALLKNK
ncbi:coiled-coil domain-containing protein 42 homolog [Chelonus insularis]|uniref:coiled-coil domain-containing protein 42 homolog n=1 Tax=Chelonus insularis TaxID=460826 RepID=UPI00158BC952|nr:coiled-coil domain-containing protein 42 homolog [Chelonus insularis]